MSMRSSSSGSSASESLYGKYDSRDSDSDCSDSEDESMISSSGSSSTSDDSSDSDSDSDDSLVRRGDRFDDEQRYSSLKSSIVMGKQAAEAVILKKKMIGPLPRKMTTGCDELEQYNDRPSEEIVMDKQTGKIISSSFESENMKYEGVYNNWQESNGGDNGPRSQSQSQKGSSRRSSFLDSAPKMLSSIANGNYRKKSFIISKDSPNTLLYKEPDIKLCSGGCTESKIGDKIENSISRFFYVVGKRIGEYPIRTIIWSMILCLVCGIGLSMFQSEERPEKLWVPQNTRASDETSLFKYYFGGNNRIDTMLISVDIEKEDNGMINGNVNMLTKRNLIEAMKLQQAIIYNVSEYEDLDTDLISNNTYPDLCLIGGGSCRSGTNIPSFGGSSSGSSNSFALVGPNNGAADDDTMNELMYNDMAYRTEQREGGKFGIGSPRLDGSSPQTPETLNPSEDSTTLREWSDARQQKGGGVFVSSSKNKNVLQNDPNTIGNQLTQSNGGSGNSGSGNRDLDTDDDDDDDDDTFNDDSAFDDDDDDAFNFLINNPLTNAPTGATVATKAPITNAPTNSPTDAPTVATVTSGTGTTGSDDFIDVSLAQDGGIMKQILTVAPIDAPSPKTNDSITADYVGTLVSNGQKFDSSIDRGQPFTFIIGQGSVIRGWDEGFLSMKIGEKALLKLRSDYAYGVRGSPPKIPSSSDLYFEVELIDINGSRGRFDNVSRKLSDLIHHHDNNDNRVLEPIEEDKTSSSSSSSLLSSSTAKTNKNTICNCVANGILSVWDYDLQLLEDDEDVMATINEKYGSRDDLDAVLGNPIFDDNDILISADAIKVTYFLKDRSYVIKGETMDPINEQWEEDVFLYNANNANDNTTTYPTIKVDYFSSRSIKDEFGGRLADDIRFVIVSYFVAFLFVATTIGSRLQCNGPGSRWTVSLGVLGIVALSTIAGLGLSSAFGLVFGPVHANLPFILLGIGVDDAFVIANAMDRERKVPRTAENNEAIKNRMARALANAGSSITVTSATDFVAFAISACSSVIPSLSSFCAFAAISICLLWLFSSTFFAAIMVLDERRQRDNRRECCCILERQPNENCLGFVVEPGDKDTYNNGRTPMSRSPPPPSSSRPDDYNRKNNSDDYYDDDSDDDDSENNQGHLRSNFDETDARGFQEGKISKYFRNYHGPFILSKWGKIISFTVFGSLLLFGIIGASKLTMEDTSREFIPPDSYLLDYWAVADDYFPSEGIEFFLTFENTNIGVPSDEGATAEDGTTPITNDDLYEYREDLANLAYRLKGLSQASPWIAEPNSISSYRNVMEGLRDYLKEFGSSKIGNAELSEDDGWPTSKEFFYYTLQQYVNPRGGPGSVYSQDVAFDNNGVVEAIRIKSMYVTLVKDDLREEGKSIDDAERQIDAMDDTRILIDSWTDLPSNRFVFCAKFFRIEGFACIKTELIVNIVLAVIAVSLIVLLTLPSLVTAFLITLNVAFCLIEILGFMWALGIAIDVTSVINLVLAVGLSVDYSAHVGHSFMMKGGYSKPKRVIEALADMGSAVLAGGMSTFLAVAVLLFLKSYVFYVLSRQLCVTVILGLAHGLILLPIMLSLWGPRPFGAATNPVYEEIAVVEHDKDTNGVVVANPVMDRGVGRAVEVRSIDSSSSRDSDSSLEKMFTDEDNESRQPSEKQKSKKKKKSKDKSKKSKSSSRGDDDEGDVDASFFKSTKKKSKKKTKKKSKASRSIEDSETQEPISETMDDDDDDESFSQQRSGIMRSGVPLDVFPKKKKKKNKDGSKRSSSISSSQRSKSTSKRSKSVSSSTRNKGDNTSTSVSKNEELLSSPPIFERAKSLTTPHTSPPIFERAKSLTTPHSRHNLRSSSPHSARYSAKPHSLRGSKRSVPWYMASQDSDDSSTSSSEDCDDSVIDSLCEEWTERSVGDPHFWAKEDDDNEGTNKTKDTVFSEDLSSSSSEESQPKWKVRSVRDPHFWAKEVDDDNEGTNKTEDNVFSEDLSSSSSSSEESHPRMII